MKAHEILSLTTNRHRLLTREAALAAGCSPSTWRRAVERGLLVQVYPGVAVAAGTTITDTVRIAAAVAVVGAGALASHRSAAFLWGAPVPGDSPVDVIDTRRNRVRRIPGIVVHRPTDTIDLRPSIRHGIACTNPLRTACDIGAVAPGHLDDVIGSFIVSRLVTHAALSAALDRHAGKGRAGIGELRRALGRLVLTEKPPDSELEEEFAAFARRFRLPSATFHAVLAGYEVDFAVDDSPLYIECVGWAIHGADRDQFEFDTVRAADLLAAGHVVIEVTWHHLLTQPDAVARRIRAAIRTWAPHLLEP